MCLVNMTPVVNVVIHCVFVTGSTEMRIKSLSAIAANPFQNARGVFPNQHVQISDLHIFDYCSYPRLLLCTFIMLCLLINVNKNDF